MDDTELELRIRETLALLTNAHSLVQSTRIDNDFKASHLYLLGSFLMNSYMPFLHEKSEEEAIEEASKQPFTEWKEISIP